jgi:hypothetical protein
MIPICRAGISTLEVDLDRWVRFGFNNNNNRNGCLELAGYGSAIIFRPGPFIGMEVGRVFRPIERELRKGVLDDGTKQEAACSRDAYRWIVDHPDFQRWRDDPGSRLVWIEGEAGKGKNHATLRHYRALLKPSVGLTPASMVAPVAHHRASCDGPTEPWMICMFRGVLLQVYAAHVS